MDPTQIELMEQMRRLLAENAANTRDMTRALGEQLQILREIKEAGGVASGSMRGAGESLDEFTNAAEGAAEAAQQTFDTMTSGLKVTDMFSNSWDLLKINFSSMLTAITTPINAVFGFLGTAFNALMKQAADLQQAMYDLLNAFEKVRAEFGSFAENTSGRVKRAFGDFNKQLRETGDGVNYFGSKFAPGIDGSVARLGLMQQYAGDLGAVFDTLGEEFNSSTSQLYMLNKSLDFNGEQLQKVGVLSRMSSLSLKDFSQGILNNVNKIGKSLGISTKVLGKDVAAAISNFSVLGKVTGDYVKQTITSAAFTRKLGIELNELANLAGKFDDFEQGAEAAAQLAQGFGLVIDPLKMMREQDPAKRLDEMRKAFAATGRSIEAMSRSERKLLAESSGLNEEQAMLAFSAKGMGLSYDQVASQADEASKQQKSQQQIISELADNIENVIVKFDKFTGFLDAFIQGFMRGFGPSLMPMVTELAKALGTVASIGATVGRIFGSMFTSSDAGSSLKGFISLISDFAVSLSGLAAIFAGDLGAGKGLGQSLENFILGTDGKGGLINLVSGSGSQLKGIISSMTTAIATILTEVFKALPSIIKSLGGLIKGGMTTAIGSMKSAFLPGSSTSGSIASGLLTTLIDVIKTLALELYSLAPVLWDMISEFFGMLVRMFKEYPIASALGSLFLAGGPIVSMISGFAGNLVDFIKNIFSGGSAVPATLASTASDMTAATESMGAPGSGTSGEGGSGVAGAVTALAGRGGFMMAALDHAASIFGPALGKAATYSALALGITVIGKAIKGVLMSFMESDFINSISSAASTLSSVSLSGLMTLGVVLGAVMIGIGAIIAGIGLAITKLPAPTMVAMLLGGGALAAIGAVLGVTGGASFVIRELIKSLTEIVRAVIESISTATFKTSLDNAAAMGASMGDKIVGISNVGSILEAVGKAVGGIGVAMDVFDKVDVGFFGGDKIDAMKEKIHGLVKLFRTDGAKFGIPSSLSLIPNIDASTFQPKIETLNTTAQMLGQLSDITTKLASIKSDASEDAAEIIKSFGAKDGMIAALPGLFSGENSLLALAGLMSGASMSRAPVDAVFDSLDHYLTRAMRSSAMLADDRTEQFRDRLLSVSDHISSIREIMEDIGEIPLDATLDAIANNMKVAKTTMSINNGAVVVKVAMTVNMNAQKMSEELVMKGFVAPSNEFRDFLNTTDGVDDFFSTEKALEKNKTLVRSSKSAETGVNKR
jgi:hypothetical protein